jgi:hypothetical protein
VRREIGDLNRHWRRRSDRLARRAASHAKENDANQDEAQDT